MRFDLGNGYCVRSFLYGDAPSLSRHGNNWNVAKNLRDSFPHPYTIEHARAWIQHVKENEADTRFVIDHQGEAIGEIGFVTQLDVHRFTAEIGYWLSESHWGKGVMTQALSRVAQYAMDELGLVRIYADVVDYNKGSGKVLEKCGFQLEGVLRKHIFKGEDYFDQYVYGLVRSDLQ
ncbi:GNAT family protein [Endozoicomonas sp. 8E]|uniref:GNAT family N-acetyltransferase n=1 Tax=Endozoicomonas sp. 8E TaxID=3035692 RepID=UPI0029391297|nr:GNAT family protein [Endozoicomonas sp. 8E]WOG29332.1 GNAT family protein [Endozoicomonas sp. 8E]